MEKTKSKVSSRAEGGSKYITIFDRRPENSRDDNAPSAPQNAFSGELTKNSITSRTAFEVATGTADRKSVASKQKSERPPNNTKSNLNSHLQLAEP